MSGDLSYLLNLVDSSVTLENGKVHVADPTLLRKNIGQWVRISSFETGPRQGWARYLVRKVALELGIFPSSINELYRARGRGDLSPTFSVPAINLRVLSFDAARAAFSAALALNASALIFEIARSEIGYTSQRPAEFSTNILAAAIAENFKGPVFIQGDHFQVSARRYNTEQQAEVDAIKDLIREAISAGFYNIDIDTSTLVDISRADITDQQKLNIELSVYLAKFIRESQPQGITISIGGEIGEVGGRNSTVDDLNAYLHGFGIAFGSKDPGSSELSKISIQTGTSHGGVVLPDGSIAKVDLDFEALRDLSRVSRSNYGLGGTVQHGASTLPESAFGKFVEYEALEVHLATNFMNMFYDQAPGELRDKIYEYLKKNYGADQKPGMTDDQFYYKTRKNAIGSFKKEIDDLQDDFHKKMTQAWNEKFMVLFELLGLRDTRPMVEKYIHPILVTPRVEDFLGTDYSAENVSDLAD